MLVIDEILSLTPAAIIDNDKRLRVLLESL
jgi:hypothetical protein